MPARRLLTGLVVCVLAVPATVAARPASPPPAGSGRVLARSEAGRPVAQVTPPPSAPASPAPDDDASPPSRAASSPSPEVAARARAVFDEHRNGRIDRSRYSESMNRKMTPDALADAAKYLGGLGAVKSFTQVRKISQGDLALYVFRIQCETPPAVEEAIAWDAAGKVAYLAFAPVTQK